MKKLFMLFCLVVCSCCSIAFAEPLKIALVGVEEGTEASRIAHSLADEIGARSGTTITLVALPGRRALKYLKDGTIDGDFSRVDGFGQDIPGLIQISEPLNSYPYLVYTVKTDIHVDGWESLKPYKVAYPRGWKVIELNLKSVHNNLHPVDSTEAGLKFMTLGRADVFINIPLMVEPLLKTGELSNKGITALQPPLDFLHSYIYLLPQHADVAKRIETALKTMKEDGTHEKLFSGSK